MMVAIGSEELDIYAVGAAVRKHGGFGARRGRPAFCKRERISVTDLRIPSVPGLHTRNADRDCRAGKRTSNAGQDCRAGMDQ